jgi:hypothetical protein
LTPCFAAIDGRQVELATQWPLALRRRLELNDPQRLIQQEPKGGDGHDPRGHGPRPDWRQGCRSGRGDPAGIKLAACAARPPSDAPQGGDKQEPPGNADGLAGADVLKISEDTVIFLPGANDPARARDLLPTERMKPMVVTTGGAYSVSITTNGRSAVLRFRMKAAGATGAVNAFTAGLRAGLLKQRKAIRKKSVLHDGYPIASAAGALTTTALRRSPCLCPCANERISRNRRSLTRPWRGQLFQPLGGRSEEARLGCDREHGRSDYQSVQQNIYDE